MGYITAAEFRAKPLGVSLRQYTDEMLNDYIEVATQAVIDLCEREFEEQTYTQVLRGDGTDTLLLREYPITDLTSITATPIGSNNGTTLDLTNLIRDDRSDNAGMLVLNGDTWSPGTLYSIVYEAGYSPVPAPVRQAVAIWVSELIKPDYGGVSADVPEIVPFSTQQIVELLGPYKRRRIG